MEQVVFKDLGRIAYEEAWELQGRLHRELVEAKLWNRNPANPPRPRKHYLLFCEHPPVYTLGKSGKMDHLLLDEEGLREKGISFYKINRGGDITYHGPGQLVAYPIFDLDGFFTDVHRYVRALEEAVILTLHSYEIPSTREPAYTGVWLEGDARNPKRKICAIGVHLSRWVTMHGLAFNVNTDLSFFRHIVPCGIDDKDKDVTSMAAELGQPQDIDKVKAELKAQFARLFDFEYISDDEKRYSSAES
ncbi:MAG: lipoyl(octanoyl) transferase LipB [Saprospirales bacterium]|nr:lipoyl(octanoyl) transferase LipB [Saprospirales bacterium]